MHPYRPSLPALLLSLWLMLSLWLLLSLALPAAAVTPRDQEITVVPAQSPAVGLPRGILQLAGSTALHFFNFRAGSPSGLQVLAGVQEGRAWVDPQEGCEVDLVFSTKPYNPEQEGEERLGRCSARVFFKKNKPRPAINVTCARLIEKAKRQEKDYVLYQQMKQLTTPLHVISIPDPYGHVDPSLSPFQDLAFLGSSYVMWEKTSQHLHYSMVQLSSVKQLKTNDDGVDFDFTVLLHEFSTQEIIPCRIQLLWYPGKPLKVKYHCQELQGPDDGSGSGSAMEPTEFSNFEREKDKVLLSNPTSSFLHKQRSRRPGQASLH
ncbi:retinoic acid receptor responder protein 1 [Acomys russatus]|uniref:retinoic acid receptor responder protein 1 n=1 Tax=Acomys russatus TaxID=60746 RepID=UPI0021E269BE|nr:retinoic acid receptor responder protein 1 [Acomys russatus]